MDAYSLGEVREILGLSRAVIAGLIEAGFVHPVRGKRREYRFSFQDLVVMRTARALAAAKLAPRRISRSLKRLREQLPTEVPLAGLRIAAVGNSVVVEEGASQWQADSGQYMLCFEVAASASGRVTFLDNGEASLGAADAAFLQGYALEDTDQDAAIDAYRRAVAANACHALAHTNLGRLLHQAGRLAEAEAVYRDALRECGQDALLVFNAAVLLEDRGHVDEAIGMYRQALAIDPALADAHYNVALLYEVSGQPRDALRHFNAYRRITAREREE